MASPSTNLDIAARLKAKNLSSVDLTRAWHAFQQATAWHKRSPVLEAAP